LLLLLLLLSLMLPRILPHFACLLVAAAALQFCCAWTWTRMPRLLVGVLEYCD
jgi:hypothetical protein